MKIAPVSLSKYVKNKNKDIYPVKNLFNKFKDRFIKKEAFLATTPLVAYMPFPGMPNGNPTHDNILKKTKEEFLNRGLPFDKKYVNPYSGEPNYQGRNLLNNYDEVKKTFEDNGLNFNNSLIDTSTGKLNSKGNSIWNHFKETQEQFAEQKVKFDSNYINPDTGYPNSNGKRILSKSDTTFKGAPEDIDESSVEMDFELQADVAELKELDTGLCPELQEVYDAPPLVTTDDVIESIFDTLPDGVDWDDWDLWSILKQIAQEIIGLEGD